MRTPAKCRGSVHEKMWPDFICFENFILKLSLYRRCSTPLKVWMRMSSSFSALRRLKRSWQTSTRSSTGRPSVQDSVIHASYLLCFQAVEPVVSSFPKWFRGTFRTMAGTLAFKSSWEFLAFLSAWCFPSFASSSFSASQDPHDGSSWLTTLQIGIGDAWCFNKTFPLSVAVVAMAWNSLLGVGGANPW